MRKCGVIVFKLMSINIKLPYEGIIDATRNNNLSYTRATLNDFPYKALYKTTSHKAINF